VKHDNSEKHFGRVDQHLALEVVYEAIKEVNSFRSPRKAISLRPDIILVGESGCLDSMEITTLALGVERRILEITNRELSLLDGADSESELSAFYSPSALADLIVAKCAN
jgi:hypothetical protein